MDLLVLALRTTLLHRGAKPSLRGGPHGVYAGLESTSHHTPMAEALVGHKFSSWNPTKP